MRCSLQTMFGALLEHAGGVRSIANRLLRHGGELRARWALGAGALLIGIPVFFDVAFIILVPLIHQLGGRTGRSTLYVATPVLAGLLVGHAFIPPWVCDGEFSSDGFVRASDGVRR